MCGGHLSTEDRKCVPLFCDLFKSNYDASYFFFIIIIVIKNKNGVTVISGIYEATFFIGFEPCGLNNDATNLWLFMG